MAGDRQTQKGKGKGDLKKLEGEGVTLDAAAPVADKKKK
jgi:hypothetical protein